MVTWNIEASIISQKAFYIKVCLHDDIKIMKIPGRKFSFLVVITLGGALTDAKGLVWGYFESI